MDIKIVNQEKANECGICVINSLNNFYFPESNVGKEQILEEIKLNPNGMSIYDLEILGSKFGVEIETYESNFKEFWEVNYSDLFVTGIKTEMGYHFVIVKRIGNKLQFYDSYKGKYKLTKEDFEKIYSGFFMTVKKKSNCEQNFIYVKNEKIFFDLPKEWSFIMGIIFLDFLNLFISIISTGYLKIALEDLIPNKLDNQLIFCFIFFVGVYLFQNISEHCISLLKAYKIEKLTKKNLFFYIDVLKKKKKSFFDNVNNQTLYTYPIFINNVVIQKYLKIPCLIVDLIFFITLFVILGTISTYYLLFVSAYILVSVIASYIKNDFNKENYQKNVLMQSKVEVNFIDLYNFLKKEKNETKLKRIETSCFSSLWNYSALNLYMGNFQAKTNLFSNSLRKIIFCIFITVSAALIIWGNSTPDLSSMVFAILLLNMTDVTALKIFDFFAEIPNYKKSVASLKSFLDTGNQNLNKDGIVLHTIESLKLNKINFSYGDKQIFKNLTLDLKNKTLLYGKNGIGKSTLCKIISLDENLKSGQIIVNDISYSDLNIEKYLEKIIYLPSEAINPNLDFTQLINNNLDIKVKILELIKKYKITDKTEEKISSGERQLLNLLFLLNCRNSLIILDESFSNMSLQLIDFYMTNFFDYLCKNNFVLTISHNKNINKYFSVVKEIKNAK